jgi:hypothetical protein
MATDGQVLVTADRDPNDVTQENSAHNNQEDYHSKVIDTTDLLYSSVVIAAVMLVPITAFFMNWPLPVVCHDFADNRLAGDWTEVAPYLISALLFVAPLIAVYRLALPNNSLQLGRSLVYAMFGLLVLFVITILAFSMIYSIYGLIDVDASTKETVLARNLKDYFYFSISNFINAPIEGFKPCPSMRLFAAMQSFLGIYLLPFSAAAIVATHFTMPNSTAKNL